MSNEFHEVLLTDNHMLVENPAEAFLTSGALLSSGKLSIILAILSLISFAASSIFILVKNSILIVLLPISDKVSIDLIPSAPPIASSIGSDISDAIIVGLAPVYLVEITTSGGCKFFGSSLVLSSKKV